MGSEQEIELHWADTPVPAARAIEHFSATEIGDGEIVLLDHERLTYHTLTRPAFVVWQLCDGSRTPRSISEEMRRSGSTLPTEIVELAIAELAEAGLLASCESFVSQAVTRRVVLKTAVAGTLGALIAPMVQSVTLPTSASAQTGCSYSGQCTTNCCANGGQIVPECANRLHAALGYPANPSWNSLRDPCSQQGLPADICVASGQSVNVTYGSITVVVPFSCK
ncbi:MAG: PqqD family protein [Thermomicrobiales bacterium]|nr:PqqD family protein [Thermomicrobiales bacterium]